MKNILLLIALLTFASCSTKEDPLLDKLKAAVEAGEESKAGYEVVDLAKLTDFEWERAYYFHQLDDKKFITRTIGFKWQGEAVPNLHRRLLFVNKGEVVKYVDYDYRELPFTLYGCGDDRWVYPRSRSSFATFKYCKGEDFIYPLIPVSCLTDFEEMVNAACPAESVKE